MSMEVTYLCNGSKLVHNQIILMTTLKFKKEIKRIDYLEKVTPYVNEQKRIQQWEVDLKNTNKLL
jgi:hypothetical protein